jgi:hypothetical protein
MLDHPYLIQPRALRFREVPPTSTTVPRLWSNLPISTQIQLAKQMAQLLCRMKSPRPLPTKEGSDADRGDGI